MYILFYITCKKAYMKHICISKNSDNIDNVFSMSTIVISGSNEKP